METCNTLIDAIGHTPLIRLVQASEMTVLCDFGSRYQSKLYNPVFLRKKGLPIFAWLAEDSR